MRIGLILLRAKAVELTVMPTPSVTLNSQPLAQVYFTQVARIDLIDIMNRRIKSKNIDEYERKTANILKRKIIKCKSLHEIFSPTIIMVYNDVIAMQKIFCRFPYQPPRSISAFGAKLAIMFSK